jgi:hypothetical protein
MSKPLASYEKALQLLYRQCTQNLQDPSFWMSPTGHGADRTREQRGRLTETRQRRTVCESWRSPTGAWATWPFKQPKGQVNQSKPEHGGARDLIDHELASADRPAITSVHPSLHHGQKFGAPARDRPCAKCRSFWHSDRERRSIMDDSHHKSASGDVAVWTRRATLSRSPEGLNVSTMSFRDRIG